MKKLISILLGTAMCITLGACASQTDKALEEASSLLDAGKYEEAIEALSAVEQFGEFRDKMAEATMKKAEGLLEAEKYDEAIKVLRSDPHYETFQSKIQEIQQLKMDHEKGFLYGKWTTADRQSTFEFLENGTCKVNDSSNPVSYSYEQGKLVFDNASSSSYSLVEKNGIQQLVLDDASAYSSSEIYVRESDYDSAFDEIEITMDNWEQYFELRQALNLATDDFGDPVHYEICYTVFLKDEYVEKYISSDISFKVQYTNMLYDVDGDLLSGDYTLANGSEFEQAISTSTLEDRRNSDYYSGISDLKDSISAIIPILAYGGDGISGPISVCEDGKVLRAEGSLTLCK